VRHPPANSGLAALPFRDTESALSRALIALGRGFTDIANAIFPGKRCAAVVLVANPRTRAALPSHLRGRIVDLPENAVDTAQWAASPITQSSSFVFIGRLVDWKALDLVIEALQSVPAATLDIIGDGPMRGAWEALAERLGLAPRITFRGWLSQARCAEFLQGSCALVLPSIYECGGAVVLEAMAMARPVIATAWGGPADYLDPSCGILLEPTSRAALIHGFADSMRLLLDAPALRQRMGEAGRDKLLRDFDWDRKIDRMLKIYASASTTYTKISPSPE
jgi:glycosyltransferase involved in cell wall biosynthesis